MGAVNRYSATVSRNALIEIHRHKTKENLWPTLRINTRKTCPVSFTAMTSAFDCDLCRATAPANFTRSDDGGYSYLF